MKKRIILFAVAALLISACNAGTKTVTNKADAKAMAETFYQDLLNADNFTMESYLNGNLSSVYTKDGDKMYVNGINAGYDYYLFMENGKKYLISSDRSLSEDDNMYDMTLDTLNMMLKMNVMSYFDIDDDTLSYKATNIKDSVLDVEVTGERNGVKIIISSKGEKQNGQINKITSEVKSGDSGYSMEYRFSYDQHIDLPEYKVKKTYDNMTHVESPYENYGQIIDSLKEGEALFYSFIEDQLIVIGEKDARYYQFSSVIDKEAYDAYNAISFDDENYDQKVYDILRNLKIDDCIDFTDELIPQEELDTHVGKTIQSFVDEGFEVCGYGLSEDFNYVLVQKDLMVYRADAVVPDDFDLEAEHEYEDFHVFEVKGVVFDSVEYAALPMK